MLVRLPLPLTPTLFPYTTLFRSVETEELLHPGNLLGPQFGAVSRPGALFIGRGPADDGPQGDERSEEHTSELQSRGHLVCRLLLEKKNNKHRTSRRDSE